MKKLICAAALIAFTGTYRLTAQDAPALQSADPPANGIWVDSLDLSKAPIRRGRGQRGQTTPPAPLVFKLSGATYAHALPLTSDGDVAIDLAGHATKFVAMVGVDDGAPPQAPAAGAPPPPPPAPGSVVFGVWVDGKKVARLRRDEAAATRRSRCRSISRARRRLVLAVNDGNDGTGGDNADWARRARDHGGQRDRRRRKSSIAPSPKRRRRSRRAAPPSRRLNYPRITGATPGRPFCS